MTRTITPARRAILAATATVVLATVATPAAAIIGGTTASEAGPQILLLRDGQVWCSGVLLDDDWVLIAAHCVESQDQASLTVAAGATELYAIDPPQLVGVAEIVLPAARASHENDIALLRTDPPVSGIAPASLPKGPVVVNDLVDVFGFGDFSSDGADGVLHFATRTVSDVTTGQTYFSTQSATSAVCLGDTGGAAMVGSTVVGVSSYFTGTCTAGEGHVHASVHDFVDWIVATTGVTAGGSEATVTATVTMALPAEACLLVDMTTTDFGELAFGGTGTSSGYTVSSCSEAAQDLFAHATDATSAGETAAWTLINGTPGVDEFGVDANLLDGSGRVALSGVATPVGPLAAGASSAGRDHTLTTPPAGSSGAGETMTFDIIWTAALAS